jgi:hypothetical protein
LKHLSERIGRISRLKSIDSAKTEDEIQQEKTTPPTDRISGMNEKGKLRYRYTRESAGWNLL